MSEIKRLKDEANRFIAILSQDDDPDRCDEMLSPGKRQSLTREVESLQVTTPFGTIFLAFSSAARHRAILIWAGYGRPVGPPWQKY